MTNGAIARCIASESHHFLKPGSIASIVHPMQAHGEGALTVDFPGNPEKVRDLLAHLLCRRQMHEQNRSDAERKQRYHQRRARVKELR